MLSEREGRRVVTEPALYLLGVLPALEEDRGACMAQSGKANPRRADLFGDGTQDAREHVRVVERRPRPANEHQVLFSGLDIAPPSPKVGSDTRFEWYGTPGMARLERADLSSDDPAPDLDVRSRVQV